MNKSDFTFNQTGYGRYKVTYTSPKTGKKYRCSTTDISIIDATKNEDSPKQKDLIHLKKLCKFGESIAQRLR